MIYAVPNSIENIIKGLKRQSRRLAQKGDYLSADGTTVYNARGHVRFKVGQMKSVQPGRGERTTYYLPSTGEIGSDTMPTDIVLRYGFVPLRIRILSIRREDIRNISAEDAKAEGYPTSLEFLRSWCSMHDKTARNSGGWSIRPADRYDAWVIGFQVAQPE